MAIPQGDMEQRKSKIQEQSPHFTIFVRLPFPRGDFVDPPPVSIRALIIHAVAIILMQSRSCGIPSKTRHFGTSYLKPRTGKRLIVSLSQTCRLKEPSADEQGHALLVAEISHHM